MTNVNQSETNAIPLDDTRKKLWADCEDLIRRIQERIFSGRDKTALRCQFAELLDRQAAITEREAIERWDGKALALYVDAESARKALAEECDEWERACDKVKAERDEFQEKLENFEGDCYCGATVVEWHEMACKLQDQVEELTLNLQGEREAKEELLVKWRELLSERDELLQKMQRMESELEAKEQLERASAYMRLPVDADGVPIRPGDTIHRTTSAVDNVVTVIGVNEKEFFFNGPNFTEPGIKKNVGNAVRHVQPDTVDSILREFTDAVLEWASQSGPASEVPTWAEMSGEYIERIRKAAEHG